MKRNRCIPFGYRLQSGAIAIDAAEAEAVREIYELYAQGVGYKTIAARMSAGGYSYHEGAVWNQHMVKRILENPRYDGADGYPVIIGSGLIERVAAVKAAKPYCRPPKHQEADERAADTPGLVITYAPNKAVLRLNNEINRALEKKEIDTASVRSLIFTCAAEKYTSLIGVIKYG